MFSFVPSAITQPFFELQPPDFAWKFVWTSPFPKMKLCSNIIGFEMGAAYGQIKEENPKIRI